MGVREILNKNSWLAYAAIVVVVAAAGAYCYSSIWGNKMPKAPDAYYFIEDGKTEFADCFAAPRDSIPPFEHEGKTAVRAHVYHIDGKDTVVYVQKMTDSAKSSLEKTKQGATSAKGAKGMPIEVLMDMSATSVLVKRPGDKEWQPKASKWFYSNFVEKLRGSDNLPLDEVLPKPK